MKVIRQQFDRLKRKIKKQANLLLDRRRNVEKRAFIDHFAEKIAPSVPEVSREDINIIVTGFISELRSLTLEVREAVVSDGR